MKKTRDIKGLLPERRSKDHYSKRLTDFDLMDLAYDMSTSDTGEKELCIDVEKVKNIIKNSYNNETIRKKWIKPLKLAQDIAKAFPVKVVKNDNRKKRVWRV